MKYPWKRHILVFLPLLVMMCGVYICLGSEENIEAFFAAARNENPTLTAMAGAFSKYGNIGFYLVYGIALLEGLRTGRKQFIRFALSYVAGLLTTLLLTDIAKTAIGRPRPLTDGEWTPFSDNRSYRSFPSGHVAETLITILPLSHRFSSWLVSLALGVSPMIMGLSRLYLGRHHPSDFLGSIVVGSIGGVVAWRVYNFLKTVNFIKREKRAVKSTLLVGTPQH